MNAKKLLTAVLALVLVCGLAACSSMQKDNMVDNDKESMQSDMMEEQVYNRRYVRRGLYVHEGRYERRGLHMYGRRLHEE